MAIFINDQPLFEKEEYNEIKKIVTTEVRSLLEQFRPQEKGGFAHLKKLKELVIGSGDTSFRANHRGIWLGNANFSDAPFSVDMDGNIIVSALDIPDTTTANSFHVDSDGNTWWGCNEADFISNIDNALAYVLKTGVAKFSKSITIGGAGADYQITWDESELQVNKSTLRFQSVFGDGSDGDVIISADTTLTSDKFYNDLTIDSTKTLTSGGYRICVRGVFTINGTARSIGAENTIGGGVAGGVGYPGGGGNGIAGTSTDPASGGNGGKGGDTTSHTGGVGGITTPAEIGLNVSPFIYMMIDFPATTLIQGGAGGGGGANENLGGGGNGGKGGGVLLIAAKEIVNAGVISANGTDGEDGTTADENGGGGGGGGGALILIYSLYSGAGTKTATGGIGGAGKGGGSNGANGSDGVVKLFRV